MKGPDGYSEEDWLALSGIQHFSFCKRQWALIHIEQLWSENGRLLALADNFEESVLRKQGVKDRPTNAIKLMSNFTAKPYTTWGTLWKQLTPYLKSANGGSWFRNEVDDVMALFKEGDFEDNHGTLTGNQAIVVWAIKRPEEKPVLNPQSGSFDFDDSFSSIADESKALHDDISDALNATNVQYAKIFSRVLRGYEGAEDLKKHNDPMVVVILDAATTGRLGVTFYCELQKDEYIKRILQWHVDAAWPLTSFKKSIVEGAERVNVVQYEGAPSFTDIINCACDTSDRSSKSYKRFAKDVKERLIECMFGGAQFPMSILNAACHKVTRPMGYDNIRVWRRDFEIACSLWKKHYIDETRKQHRQEDVITMYLEPNRDDRDYLYYLTTAGHLEHERAHDYAASESRGDMLIMRDLRVYSRALGITGACDVVEFHKSNDGVPLHGRDELWLPYPIEYKHGKSKTIDADRLQLCAEAMCLEEMLACDIPEGALFYQQTKRRERVKFDEDLRNMVEADFLQMHDLFSRGWTPKVKQTRSCSACSLRDLCLPELRKMKSAKAYIEERLKESGE